jgi:hypothetical protein
MWEQRSTIVSEREGAKIGDLMRLTSLRREPRSLDFLAALNEFLT